MAGPIKSTSVNIQAVAAAAGVSKTTVSHVLSGKRHVAEKTKQHVAMVMQQLGYTPNFLAQALATQRTSTIALLTHDITNPFYPALARGVQHAATARDHILMLFDAGPNGENLHSFFDVAKQRRVDGIIAAVSDADADLRQMRAEGIPVVTVGPTALSDLDWVSVDDEAVGEDAVSRLYAAGRRRIAIINGNGHVMPGSARLRGYLQAISRLGLQPNLELVQDGDWSRESGAKAMDRLLELADPPTAVFCANDVMAIGAMDAAFAHRISVPSQLAIIGVDDIEAASLVRPALTTIRVPAREIGVAAGERLLDRMAGDDSPVKHVLLAHTLIPRDTA